MKIKSEGKDDFERFDNAMKKVLSVSHEEMQRRLREDPRGHSKATAKKRKIRGKK
jgi:hypothetical protein